MIVHNICFILFNIIYIILPGAILLKKANIIFIDNSVSIGLLFTYFLGFGVLVMEYFICSILHIFWLFALLTPIILIIFIIVNRRNICLSVAEIRKRMDINKTISYLSVLFICFVLSFIYTTFQTGNVIEKPYVNMREDVLNHIGLTASLSKGLPASDLKVSGITLFYHYFNDLLFGMCENIFHISAFDLVIDCTPVMIGGLLGTALFGLLKKNTSNKYSVKDGIVSMLRCAFFFVFGGAWAFPLTGVDYTSGFWNWNNYHLLANDNACGFAIASIVAILLFIKNISVDSIKYSALSILAILVFSATGAKGPFAIVFVAAFAGVYLIRTIIERHINLPMLAYVVVSGISFIITYIVVIHGTTQYGQSKTTQMEIAWNGTLNRTMISSYNSIGLFSIPYIGNWFRIGLILLVSFGPLIFYVVFTTVREIRIIAKNHAVKDVFSCTSIGMIIIGAIGFIFVSQSGYSQVYFLFVAIIPLVYFSLDYTEHLVSETRWKSIFCLCLIALFGTHLLISDLGIQLKSGYAARGLFGYSESLGPSLGNVSSKEISGLRWLYNNTPSNSLILTDRRSTVENDQYTDDCRFFAYSAISERQMYIEGFSYSAIDQDEIHRKIDTINLIYSSSGQQLEDLLKQTGIDYIIVTKRMGTNFTPESNYVELCFDNADISIYSAHVR